MGGMMKLEDIHIGVSPLTGQIYLGTVSKQDRSTWANKIDCTSKFLTALMNWLPEGTKRIITDKSGGQWEIEIRRMPNEETDDAPTE
jgi:hypothetical protein